MPKSSWRYYKKLEKQRDEEQAAKQPPSKKKTKARKGRGPSRATVIPREIRNEATNKYNQMIFKPDPNITPKELREAFNLFWKARHEKGLKLTAEEVGISDWNRHLTEHITKSDSLANAIKDSLEIADALTLGKDTKREIIKSSAESIIKSVNAEKIPEIMPILEALAIWHPNLRNAISEYEKDRIDKSELYEWAELTLNEMR